MNMVIIFNNLILTIYLHYEIAAHSVETSKSDLMY